MNYIDLTDSIKKILKEKKENCLQEIIDLIYSNFSHYNWIGIYIVKDGMLHLGPWNGEHATEHVKIPIGKGICGSAAKTGNTEIIPDVRSDDRYLACFISTKSEIVVPIKKGDQVLGEIDIDSDKPNAFTDDDKEFLENIADMLSMHIHNL